MRIVFMGTPEFAVPGLRALVAAGHEVAAVVTQPDRPQGRGMAQAAPPVKLAAQRLDLPISQPEKVSAPAFVADMAAWRAEVVAVVAFGQLIPATILGMPPHGCINVHPSLLPRYRGATPIQSAILNGDTITGVTTMFLDAGLDTGDIILQQETPIGVEETAGDLHDRLATLGADLLVETMRRLAAGTAPRRAQDARLATVCRKLTRAAGQLRWPDGHLQLANQVRAFAPWPGAFTFCGAERVKVLAAAAANAAVPAGAAPGAIVDEDGEDLLVACGAGQLRLRRVQPENGKPMSAAAFARGRHLSPGACFTWRDEDHPAAGTGGR